jgi:two-component system, sensor histidine kinase YesM
VINLPTLKDFDTFKQRIVQWYADGAPKSVKTTLILYFTIVIVLPLFLLGTITYTISSQTITNRVQSYVEQIIIKVKENIEYYFRDLQSLSYVISVNPDVITVLKDRNNLGGWKEIGYQNKIKSFLAGLTSTRAEVKGIYVLSDDLNRIYSSDPPVLIGYLQKQPWFRKIIHSEAGMVVTGVHSDNYSGSPMGMPGDVVTYAQRIVDLDTQKNLGWILIDLDYGFVPKMLENVQLWDQGQITILDESGRAVFGNPAMVNHFQLPNFRYLRLRDWGSYLQRVNGREELLVFQTVSLCNWKVIFSIPAAVLQRENIFIRNFTLLLAFILLGVAIYLAVLFTRKIAEPIHLLHASMHEVEKGNLNIHIKVRSMSEFNELAVSFNHMVEKIQTLMTDINDAEKKKQQAELNVLQAQINPHFLYNTLDSLRWLAKIRNVEEISDIISALENLLRASISKTDQLIPIGQELENVRNYIAIQLFRYGNGFAVIYDVNPQVSEYFTPKLILQPMVENAIYHGIEGLAQGEIKIHIDTVDENVVIEVSDNGKGIDSELAARIMAGKVESNQRFSGLGIKNVDERIKLNFGRDYGISISANDPKGTRVTIIIPRLRKFDKRKSPK